ncbi:MAG: response regulator [bacterium]|nr:response regulator [bacterium]
MANQTILIIDDDKKAAQSLKESILELKDTYIIEQAENGNQAFEALVSGKIDLAVMDINIPGMNGSQVLEKLDKSGIWMPVIIISDSDANGRNSYLNEFGIVDFIIKPFQPQDLSARVQDILKNRKKKDLIKNFSLPSILQLIEMDKRTGILTMKIGAENGRLFFKDGKVRDIVVKGLSAGDALQQFIHTFYEDRELSIEYIDHRKAKKVDMTLMQMVMEASRIKDERKAADAAKEPQEEPPKPAVREHLPAVIELLDSLKEVGRYIIATPEGEIIGASPNGFNESLLSSSLYLWVTGDQLGSALKLGKPSNLVCYFKGGKRLVQTFEDYIIMMELAKIAKYSVFKEKLNERFHNLGNSSRRS